MIDRDKVVNALRNCINKPKCQDCPWEECENIDHETFELPKGLVMDMYDLLKAQKSNYEAKVPVQSLIDHIKTAIDVDPWAKKMAEKLLKKQEPKDIKSYYGLAGGPHGACPSCCTTIPRILGQETRFCPFCGQAVKWE